MNKRQGRVGHLFQGRYKAILVDANAYLLQLVRYIHLNPVRARLVATPSAYAWSGHRGYLGQEEIPWLTTEWVLGQLAKRLPTARKRYVRFVNDGIGEGWREDFHRGTEDARVLGDDRFMERVSGVAGKRPANLLQLDSIMEVVCGSYDVSKVDLSTPGRRRDLAEARALVAYLAITFGKVSLTEVATRFERDVATLSTGVRRLTLRSRSDRISQAAKAVLRKGSPISRPLASYNRASRSLRGSLFFTHKHQDDHYAP